MIPRHSYSFNDIVLTMYFLFSFSFVLHTLASPTLHFCRHDQRNSLLEFKQEFPVNYMSSWNKSSDCCSWEGVTCDERSGKVISLYIDNIPLNNSLKPNSGLFKLQFLQNLVLSSCDLYGQIPSSIGNLTQLNTLRLTDNHLSGKIPVSFANLTKLATLHLTNNDFESELPPDLGGLHNLEYLFLSGNSFSGPFPTFLFTIPSLQYVYMKGNQLKGPIEFSNTSSSSRLRALSLAGNKCDGPIPESISKFLDLNILDLSFNDFIGSIPRSISQLANLTYFDLSHNKLEGKVPGFLWRLEVLKLAHNSFSSFGKSSEVLDRTKMNVLSLRSNSFLGPFPRWICKFRSLDLLDLSNNRFSGSIPPCIRRNNFKMLNLGNNNFSGTLPDMFVNGTNLLELDVSRNQLEGKLPKSLISCVAIKFLNVGSNKFKDEFPSWLGSLPSLNVLILRSNQFYGPLYNHHVSSIGFQTLKVIDISKNDFTGTITSFYFSTWRDMTTSNALNDDSYMEDFTVYVASYHSSMEMVHKGVYTEFLWIRKDFIAIDFSENRFYGKIPESIGFLKGLHLLNLSSNAFTSDIPQSLANLTNLEALDLSQNQLSGRIPQDLGMLSFLSTINFSHNNLEGPIPRGTQFQIQNCSSFIGNPRLYGPEEICGQTYVPNTTPQKSEDVLEQEDDEQVISWIAAAIAYGPGVFCGLVIGHIFVSHKQEWFIKRAR
ncbi:hypothetical protein EUTSA_v10027661mg [Eutrema salsugineum]|uniref:Leucine-rich repeat-containing N-terminal plant-type domain-containing protein n=2 Tax=Eutrema salsugineum TaxID=72664 RepID=V4LT06_EUTSA|nr:hypothetical protein EUTSA_v10027661mg [Eutrema salsugineum]